MDSCKEICRFSIRIKPHSGESLSSFMMRLASANGMNFLSLWNLVRKNNRYAQMSNIRFIDIYSKNIFNYKKFAYMSGLNFEEILKMTLIYLFDRFCISENIDRSRFLSGMIRDELHYCPLCIKENLFNRQLWKFEGIDCCVKHGIYLLNKCYVCDKPIKYSEIEVLGECPHCQNDLSNAGYHILEDTEFLNSQSWLTEAFTYLSVNNGSKINGKDEAIKLLYILSGFSDQFERGKVKNELGEGTLSSILQHARGSLSQERTLHISFIFGQLIKHKINLCDFLNMNVPKEFIDSIVPQKIKKNNVYCKAPWCKDYLKENSLIKIGTGKRRTHSDDFKSYYYICNECYSEYACVKNGELEYRTINFIKEYEILKKILICENMSLKDLSNLTDIPIERLRRCLAYFSVNNILHLDKFAGKYKIDEELIKKFIELINIGINIEEILKKVSWTNYNQYLAHRFHKNVLRSIAINQKNKHTSEKTLNSSQEQLTKIVECMLRNNEKITLRTVCKQLGVCHETIRNWGCNSYIAQKKKAQKRV